MLDGMVQLTQAQVRRLVDIAGVLRREADECAKAKHWRAAAMLIAQSVEAGLIATVWSCESELRTTHAWPPDLHQIRLLKSGRLAGYLGWRDVLAGSLKACPATPIPSMRSVARLGTQWLSFTKHETLRSIRGGRLLAAVYPNSTSQTMVQWLRHTDCCKGCRALYLRS